MTDIRISNHTYADAEQDIIFLSNKVVYLGKRKWILKLPRLLRELVKGFFWRELSQIVVERSLPWLLEHEMIHIVLDKMEEEQASDKFDRIWNKCQSRKPYMIKELKKSG